MRLDPILENHFLERFKSVIEVFGKEKFSKEYLFFAQKRTNDLTVDEMTQVCNLLIDNCERAPTIVKVVGFSSMVRAKRFKVQDVFKSESILDCYECDDLGVVRTKGNHGDLVMRCPNLKCVPSYYWQLPRWSDVYSKEFKCEKFPAHFFKPEKDSNYLERANEWRQHINLSTHKFNQCGYPNETTTRPPNQQIRG